MCEMQTGGAGKGSEVLWGAFGASACQKVEGLMYGAGTSLIEIFPNAEEDLPQGAIRHFALATDDVDSIVETVRKAGYAVTMEPVDIEIMSKPSLPARIAFIIGPVGEEIELFCEKQ